uniref:Single-stranded DNA-binding protein n=1 Tax=Ascaris suum TaxID=6253 RepID=F1LGM2_ASCSU
MINNVVLTGRLTNDPELNYYNGEKSVCYFTIAVNRNYKNANGEYEADFIKCKAYRNSAEYLAKYVNKGDLVGVVGSIEITEKDGTWYTNVSCQSVQRLQISNENKTNKLNSWAQPTNNSNSWGARLNEEDQKLVNDFMNLDDINDDDLPF